MRQFIQEFHPTSQTRVLDVGGTPFNWTLVDADPHVTILNVRTPNQMDIRQSNIEFVAGDARDLDYEDQFFDVVFSNSVIEHLGTLEEQQRFARETRRVGRNLWVQTPSRHFFMEPHLIAPFIHYFPKHWRLRLVRRFTPWGLLARPTRAQVNAFVDEVRLLDFGEMRALYPDCEIRRERFLGMTKSYVAVRRIG